MAAYAQLVWLNFGVVTAKPGNTYPFHLPVKKTQANKK